MRRGGRLLLYTEERECLSALCAEEADFFSIQKRESVSLRSMDEADFVSIQRRESVSRLYVEEADPRPHPSPQSQAHP